MRSGKVFLIGAGPGDIELLTLKAIRCLGLAQVILLDDLVNREILKFACSNARVIEVGKRGGCKSTPQEFIVRKMIAEAKAGFTVARVKGGDPFVFGRGGEEVQALRSAGIEVEIVSGITAGIAVPAALGIPVTHRDYTPGVVFVTGHAAREPNWRALAGSGMTIVVYMGLAKVAKISSALIESGLSPRTPAAVIQNGTLRASSFVIPHRRNARDPEFRNLAQSNFLDSGLRRNDPSKDGRPHCEQALRSQRSVFADIGRLPDLVRRAGIDSPAIIVIGEVVSLAHAQIDIAKAVA